MNLIHLFFLLFLAILSSGCTEQRMRDAASEVFLDKNRQDALRAKRIRKGKELYRHYCLLCHGEEGKGDGYNAFTMEIPPGNLADQNSMRKFSDEQLYSLIAKGSAHLGMPPLCPPWGKVLKKGEVQNLIVYVRSLSLKNPSDRP